MAVRRGNMSPFLLHAVPCLKIKFAPIANKSPRLTAVLSDNIAIQKERRRCNMLMEPGLTVKGSFDPYKLAACMAGLLSEWCSTDDYKVTYTYKLDEEYEKRMAVLWPETARKKDE